MLEHPDGWPPPSLRVNEGYATTTRALSREEDLTSYEAAYLELALRRRLPRATCDDALLAAARRRQVDVLSR